MATTGQFTRVNKRFCSREKYVGNSIYSLVCPLLIYLVQGQEHVVCMGLVAGSRGGACGPTAIAMQLSKEMEQMQGRVTRRKEMLRLAGENGD